MEVGERLKFFGGAGLPRPQLHVGDRHLARVRVGAADCSGQGYGGMRLQSLLDLLGIDIVAAADDQLLLAPGQPEVALRILATQIARIQPALTADIDPQSPVMALLQIAVEQVRATDRDQADFIHVGIAQVLAGVIEHDHAHILVGDPYPDGADTALAMGRIDRGDAGALGEAVAFEDLHPGPLLELAE
ncbi:hypothetical protein D3C78_1269360 [compost metagenome]